MSMAEIKAVADTAAINGHQRRRTLAALYAVYAEGKNEPLGATHEQWNDYVRWRRAWYDAAAAAFPEFGDPTRYYNFYRETIG